MPETTAAGEVVWPEKDAYIRVKLGLLKRVRTRRFPAPLVQGQVALQPITHAFFGIDVAVDRFLTNALLGAFMDQLALRETIFLRALVYRRYEVSSVVLGEGFIGPEVALYLANDR
jgi:hypothetical protein